MMDTDKLVEKIRKRFDHVQAKRVLQEKYQAKMMFAYSGGMWCAGPELITQCNLCRRVKKSITATLARAIECMVR
jgi:hypothetical protein